jgi:hypothetical protein
LTPRSLFVIDNIDIWQCRFYFQISLLTNPCMY